MKKRYYMFFNRDFDKYSRPGRLTETVKNMKNMMDYFWDGTGCLTDAFKKNQTGMFISTGRSIETLE